MRRPSYVTTVLAALGIAAFAGSASGAATVPITVRVCSSADCVPDLVTVSVRSQEEHVILSKSGGDGSIVDLSPGRNRVLINQGLRLVSATTSRHVIRRLADGLGTIGPARWSPDGRLIVFSVRGGGSCGSTQLWVVQVSGSGLRKLSDCANYPAWAPDSKHIVFIGNFSDGRSGSVSVIDVDGNERKDLVDWSGTSAPTLAWAPRGDRIAFTAGSGAGAVEIVDAAMKGNAVTIRHASSPAWRPDGRGLAIIRIQRPYDRLALQVVRPDGSNVQRVDRGAGISTPAWSRDGRLAYLKTPIAEGGGLGVFVARPGAPPRRLTQEPSDTVDFGLFWSLRSDRIFYLRCRT